jgi:hypothetical protein
VNPNGLDASSERGQAARVEFNEKSSANCGDDMRVGKIARADRVLEPIRNLGNGFVRRVFKVDIATLARDLVGRPGQRPGGPPDGSARGEFLTAAGEKFADLPRLPRFAIAVIL